MQVRVSDSMVDYISDYPASWSTISGDYYKIVQLDDTDCFIKRFEKKNPDQISGWKLLAALRGQNNSEAHIPRIFDIKQADTNEYGVYYVFYECLKGRTIDTISSLGDTREVRILKEDLFTALDFLNEKGFWFPDLIEKNVFRENSGKYKLIDLDSAHPLSTPPGNGLYGDQFYLNTVMHFYQNILKQNQDPAKLGGEILNRLQVVFMILNSRLKIEEKKQGRQPGNNYDILHLCLDATMPDAKSLFRECANGNKSCNNRIKEFCDRLLTATLIVPQQVNKQKPIQPQSQPLYSDFIFHELAALRSRINTYAICGLVLLGIIFISIFVGLQFDSPSERLSSFATSIALMIPLIISSIMLFKFSAKMNRGLTQSKPAEINASLQQLKSFFTFQLVLRIILIIAGCILLIALIKDIQDRNPLPVE